METVNTIIFLSLTIGVICTFLLWLHDRKPYLGQETYKAISVISFIFNITGSFLCLSVLLNGG
ncbi:hypothetical protein ACFSC6_10445 [Rufibacter sediminis]|uniref:Uncharacterized protein n=1 Tax=Rufibacter sediminis TaxID=2762756 RepID=A0ABR6VP46_9BACT|nr:hypothetical protein [Rufibacter sediminis]MBC3538953.1 hypothetical protein [Rufibacter sediminis]